nr:hypothetical protein [Tanacetum cinerariifolium]
MDFLELCMELEAYFLGEGAQLMGLQLFQLEFRLEKIPFGNFRPAKSAKIFLQFWASCSFRVSLDHDGSWSKRSLPCGCVVNP